jgi:hypothetical protein
MALPSRFARLPGRDVRVYVSIAKRLVHTKSEI